MVNETESTAPHNDTIKKILDKTGVAYKYRKFKGKAVVPIPFIVYYFEHERHYGSDDRNRIIDVNTVIELYTASKDFSTEQKIEAELFGSEFEKTEDFDSNDEVFRITYEFTINVKIRRQ